MAFLDYVKGDVNVQLTLGVVTLFALVFASLAMASSRKQKVDASVADALVTAGYGTSTTEADPDGTLTTVFTPKYNVAAALFVVAAVGLFAWGGFTIVAKRFM